MKFSAVLQSLFVGILIVRGEITFESDYDGNDFPSKYLVSDETLPTKSDLNKFLIALTDSMQFFYDTPNETDGSGGIGLFFSNSMLKKILLDYSNKLTDHQKETILNAIDMAEYTLSHYLHMFVHYDLSDLEYRFSRILRRDEEFIYSIREFNENRLKPWLLNKSSINNLTKEFDNMSLPKEKYVELVENVQTTDKDYFMKIHDSDKCLSNIIYHPEPSDPASTLRPCAPDPFCKENTHKSPSVAYTLSHRFLNIFMLQFTRRCYMVSEHEDNLHMDMLCAQMYRETVYIARRGFFFKDLFLEHIALCAFLGYKEFHRLHWFHKALSWIKDEGCIAENHNFWYNCSTVRLRNIGTSNKEEIKKVREFLREGLTSYCHRHPTILLIVVIVNAIRYTLHFMDT